jgi:hypothetical protein
MFIKLIADLDQQAAVDEHRALTLSFSLSLQTSEFQILLEFWYQGNSRLDYWMKAQRL